MKRVLEEDLDVAKRAPANGSQQPFTLTVTLNQRLLEPGVSLKDLSPGEPDVSELLKAAGADPPALADTGSSETDPYEGAALAEARDPLLSQLGGLARPGNSTRTLGAFPSYAGKEYSPYANIPAGEIYDTAIVCHATLNGGHGQLTAVAVLHPGEDPREARKLIAETIADKLLH